MTHMSRVFALVKNTVNYPRRADPTHGVRVTDPSCQTIIYFKKETFSVIKLIFVCNQDPFVL